MKIVHEVQQEKLKYTKETEQYTALGYHRLTTLSLCRLHLPSDIADRL